MDLWLTGPEGSMSSQLCASEQNITAVGECEEHHPVMVDRKEGVGGGRRWERRENVPGNVMPPVAPPPKDSRTSQKQCHCQKASIQHVRDS